MANTSDLKPFADVADKISFCFGSPNDPPERHTRAGLFSVLYLLRRELIETAGYDPNKHDEAMVDREGIRNRLFVSLIAMFTAFDLLAKFQLGDTGGVGQRFKDFLKSPSGGGGMPPEIADLFYAVRNSLTHAFGVPDVDALAGLGLQGIELHQRVQEKDGGLVVVQHQKWHPAHTIAVLYIDGVFRTLLTAITGTQARLVESADARKQFELMFDKYGTIRMSRSLSR